MADLDQMLAQQAGGGGVGDAIEQLLAQQAQIKPGPDAPVSVQAGAMIANNVNSVPRQFGLAARYGIEGLANLAQIVTEPIRHGFANLASTTPQELQMKPQPTLSSLVTGPQPAPQMRPMGSVISGLLDRVGLPSPQTADERVVGDATRLMAGAGGLGGAARAATVLPGLLGEAGTALSSNMGSQLLSAAGSGLAGGAAREAGAGPWTQAGASLLGGVAAGSIPGVLGSTKRAVAPPTPQEIDAQLNVIFQQSGVDLSALPAGARNALREDMAQALRTGQEINPDAVRRLADFRTVGATPTRGMVSLNPVQITREQNLAKIGANSSDEGLSGLAGLQNQNNATFIRNLNDQGAGRGDLQRAGEAVTGAVLGRQAGLRGAEQSAWTEAKGSPSYTQPIYPDALHNINRSLGDEGMMPFLNPTISRYMEAFQTGQQPFTPQAYRNLQSMLSNELARGGNEAAAARIARNALNDTPIQPVTAPVNPGNLPLTGAMAERLRAMDGGAGEAVSAVDRARAATRAAYAYEESSPLVRRVLSVGDAGDPMKVAKRYVIGGTPNEAETLAREVGDAGRGPIRDAIVAHLKKEALNGAKDEVGKFSQSAYNQALSAIGDRKLALFFSPEEVSQLRALGRVASYAQVQPVGSAVNNSNSGALVVGKVLDALGGLAKSAPILGPLVTQPLANGINSLSLNLRTNQARNVVPGLLAPQPQMPVGQGLLLPAAAAGGLLAAP